MSDTPNPTPRRGFWGSLKAHIIHPELTPKRVAWSFAIGFSIAWNPFLGLHTAMILLLCLFARKLHRPLIFLACFINNPWTMVPMATTSTLLGSGLLGRGWKVDLSSIRWTEIGWRSFISQEGLAQLSTMFKPILAPYLLGGMVMSILALPLGYWVMHQVALKLRARHLYESGE
ncbi:MAG TPA: DUF2062 domain-containing protein [Holophagaceae bacterium]|nr:DUF2062 domain-containing protein [Holophagaceae bacterium]